MRHKFGYRKLNKTGEHRKALFQNMLNFPIEVDSKNWAKIPQKKWYDNCAVLRLLRQIEYHFLVSIAFQNELIDPPEET